MVSSRGTQRYAYSRLYKPGSRSGVLMLFGRGGTRDSWFAFNDALWPSGEISSITDAGFPVGSIDTGVLWGNSTMLTNISTLKTAGQTALFAAGGVHLLGASAGGLAVLAWATANPSLVKSITLVVPALDVQHIHTNDLGGFAAEIETAYGGAPADADNPIDNLADFEDFPIDLYYSTDDPYTPLATTEAFIDGVGSNVTGHNMGAQAHAWTVPWSGANVAAFISEND